MLLWIFVARKVDIKLSFFSCCVYLWHLRPRSFCRNIIFDVKMSTIFSWTQLMLMYHFVINSSSHHLNTGLYECILASFKAETNTAQICFKILCNLETCKMYDKRADFLLNSFFKVSLQTINLSYYSKLWKVFEFTWISFYINYGKS